MKLFTLWSLLRGGRLPLLLKLSRLLNSSYRANFLSAAAASGLLDLLAAGPVPFQEIAARLAPDPAFLDALTSWLQVGVKLGDLRQNEQGYFLGSRLAKKLADPRHDYAAAFLEEAVVLHRDLIRRFPLLAKEKRRFTLADQDGELIARSSRMIEPLVFEAIDSAVPKTGSFRLLEVGCGSGIYLKYSLERNPNLLALGIELQPPVAQAARSNLESWRLDQRADIVVGDIRTKNPKPIFDLVTLHNNIYYFPFDHRPELLSFLRGFLKPGGRLLLTTGCRGGSVIMELLNLWGAATEGCGQLPTPQEMVQHLRQGGFSGIKAHRLYPFETFYSFLGTADSQSR